MKAKKLIGLMLAGMMAVSMAACGSGGGQSSSSGSGAAAGTAASDMSICTIVQPEDPIYDWDPAISYCGDEHTFINIYETLLRYDANTGEYANILATDYEASDDGLEWTFYLREGVKFHDGSDFTAEDVKFSIERNKRLDKGAAYIWNPVDEVEIVDDYTVKIKLSSPCNMAEVVSCQFCGFIYSSEIGDDDKASTDWFYEGNECGTGPYMLQNWTAGSNVVLTRFEDYWGGWEGDHFDKAIVQMVTESSTRRQMIESGEADMAQSLSSNDLDALDGKDGLHVDIDENTSINTSVWFNVEKEKLKDVNIRKALAYAFPFEDVLSYSLHGKYGRAPVDVLCPSGAHGATESQPYYYDLDLAKEYLAKAGYPDGGLEFTVAISNYMEETKSILEIWQSELAKINVALDIQMNAEDAVFSQAKGPLESQQDILVQEVTIDLISAYSAYVSAIATGASWNFANYSDSWVDENLAKVNTLAATDLEQSDTLMQEIGTKVAEDCPVFNIYDRNTAFAIRDDFVGFKHNTAYMCGCFIYDCHREK